MASGPPESLFNQVNYITQLWQDPCSAPWEVYVETAFPHALELLIAAGTFGGASAVSQLSGFMEEVIEGVADPGGYNLFRRGLRGSRRGRFRNPLMSLPDKVARRQPGFTAIQSLTDNTAGRSFFTVYNLAERANLAWFLANKARDEFIDWTTALYQTQKCSEAGQPRVGADFGGQWSIPISGFVPIYLGGPDYAENGAGMVNGIPSLNGARGSYVASNTMRDDDDDFDYYMQLKSTQRGIIREAKTSCSKGQDCTLMLSCEVRPDEHIQALVLADGAITKGVSGFLRATGANAAAGHDVEPTVFGVGDFDDFNPLPNNPFG